MNKLATLEIIALAVLFAGLAGAQSMTVQAPPGGIDVNVVNPPAVDVSNAPETPLHVRDVDRRARLPYSHGCGIFIEDGDTSDTCAFQPDVPAGQRLVVEFISGWIEYPVGKTGQVHTLLVRGGFNTTHFLLQTLQRTNVFSSDHYVVSQPLRIDVPEEGHLSVRIIRSPDDTGTVDGDFWVTGYLVDVEAEE
jgi:hypothetical protein